jgi:hypothetical protein
MRSFDFKDVTVSLLDDQILHIHLKANAEITMADAILVFEAMEKLGKGKKMPVFIDAGEFCSVDKEVREFSASKEGNIFTLADAIAYSSLAQKIIANFYVNKNEPVIPTRVFSNIPEALSRLKGFIK